MSLENSRPIVDTFTEKGEPVAVLMHQWPFEYNPQSTITFTLWSVIKPQARDHAP